LGGPKLKSDREGNSEQEEDEGKVGDVFKHLTDMVWSVCVMTMTLSNF
jgi:hypothetical protein